MLKKEKETAVAEEGGGGMAPTESENGTPASSEPAPKEPINPDSELFVPVVTPIVLEVSDALVPFVDSRQDNGKFLFELIPFMRDGLFVELGVRFPGVRARGNSGLPPGAYQIQINEVPVVTGQATIGHVLVNDTVDRLKLMNIAGLRGHQPRHPPARRLGARAAQGHARGRRPHHLGRARLHHPPPGRHPAPQRPRVRRRPGSRRRCWTSWRRPSPPSSRRSCPRSSTSSSSRTSSSAWWRRRSPSRDLRGILQSLAEYGQVEADNVMLTEHVRASLRRYISHKYARGTGTLVVYLLDPQIEEAIRGSIKRTSAGTHLALEPELAQEIVQAVKAECGHLPPSAQRPVILTAMDIRRYVRKLLEYEFNPAVLRAQLPGARAGPQHPARGAHRHPVTGARCVSGAVTGAR